MEIALWIALAFALGLSVGNMMFPKEQRIYHYHDAKEKEYEDKEEEYNPSYADIDYKKWFDENK